MYHDPIIAYLAGFFDGEGSVMIQRHNRKRAGSSGERYMTYRLGLKASQLEEHREPLDMLHRVFGGHIYRSVRGGNRRVQCSWQVTGERAYRALKAMFPYLQVKGKVAALGMLQWCAHEEQIAMRKNKTESRFDFGIVCQGTQRAVSFFNGKHRSCEVSGRIN